MAKKAIKAGFSPPENNENIDICVVCSMKIRYLKRTWSAKITQRLRIIPHLCLTPVLLGPVYMRGGTGRFPGRDVFIPR